jgi:hypothetical protein
MNLPGYYKGHCPRCRSAIIVPLGADEFVCPDCWTGDEAADSSEASRARDEIDALNRQFGDSGEASCG